MTQTLCAVPWSTGFTDNHGGYRNCCVATPQIQSQAGESFATWWHSKDLEDFRNQLSLSSLPSACQGCRLQEQVQGSSFRTAVNSQVTINSLEWPSRWNVMFGNTCNLGCWSCDEYSSSVIETQKKKLGLLPVNYIDSEQVVDAQWSELESNILRSYETHQTVTLTILGGEPLFNVRVLEFLQLLITQGLSTRTRLEFHTNGTVYNTRINQLLQNSQWQYICLFVSLDAVGKLAEWVRYNCRWDSVNHNVSEFKRLANYIEVHCTLSVLNIGGLFDLYMYCKDQELPLNVAVLENPNYMSLSNWDQHPARLCDRSQLESIGFENYYDLIGKTAQIGSREKLYNYINQFDSIRANLTEFDLRLALAIDTPN